MMCGLRRFDTHSQSQHFSSRTGVSVLLSSQANTTENNYNYKFPYPNIIHQHFVQAHRSKGGLDYIGHWESSHHWKKNGKKISGGLFFIIFLTILAANTLPRRSFPSNKQLCCSRHLDYGFPRVPTDNHAPSRDTLRSDLEMQICIVCVLYMYMCAFYTHNYGACTFLSS